MNQFSLIFKIVTSQMRLHPGRVMVTILGVVASTCAVVWVVSGYDALVSQFDQNAHKYLGRYDALIVTKSGSGNAATLDPRMVELIQQDAGVMEANPISQSRITLSRVKSASDPDQDETSIGLLVGDRPPVNGAPPLDPTLISTPAIDPPYEMVDGQWLASEGDRPSAVISVDAARKMDLQVGDRVLVTSLANQISIPVVGVIQQAREAPSLGQLGGGRGTSTGTGGGIGGQRGKPGGRNTSSSGAGAGRADASAPPTQHASARLGLPGSSLQGVATTAVYVRPPLAETINGYPSAPQIVQVSMRDSITVDQFRERWEDQFAASSPPMQLIDFAAVRDGLESSRSVSSQQSQAWAATGMASLAAVFIIFSTLSMGVSERTREFAMLRAVALTRGQVAGIIAFESTLLALAGWIGGLATGWMLLFVGGRLSPGLFGDAAVLGWGSAACSGLAVLVGALGAAVLPAWRAMRIQPLDAMSVPNPPSRSKAWWLLGCIGVVVMLAAPISVFALAIPDQWRIWCYTFVTYPMLLLGMVMVAPTVVVLCERTMGPVVTRMLRLDPRMMQTQLSASMWRTIGATLALSVGLGLYASTQTWGYSMLQPFTPGKWLPDMLVAFHPIGLDQDGDRLVHQVDGVRSGQVMPLSVEQAKFDWGDVDPPKRLTSDNAVLFGLDPEQAFGSDDPFLTLDFVAGDRQAATDQLSAGGACLISEDFQIRTGLGVGDDLRFTPPSAQQEHVSYRIAGVVSLPGWHWFTKFSGVRRHFVRTATMVFAKRDDVHRDFHLNRTEFYWMNLDDDANLASVESRLQRIADRDAGSTFTADSLEQVKAYRPFARVTATERVRTAIRLRADGMIWGMSYLPLVTLAIMSLAVANTIIASVRSRTWEFGVMRAIGVSRSQLVRLVIAETILIALAACMLSLTFGLIAGWCGVGMARYGGWFAGPPSFLVPWGQLAIGFLITIGLCLIAGLWPAIKTGRAEPLGLLQAGRGAM
ncbi:FtsX-like permease family protein [Rubripirellula lacrimiformis]|uniref:FtsX-like permease family protein n=1 Tax=Rubripirellula lacrimiformis TaxID=1930273 RepID=UPI001FEBE145|nr:FtsX family ABC transporter permease [Rubripirellula lacrimiformis]